jgi:hypothetical protein
MTLRATYQGKSCQTDTYRGSMIAMATGVIVALVGAGAALLGGLLTAFATRRVEVLRLRANLLEKADERRLAALEQFMLAVNGWLDWLIYMEEQGWRDRLDELNRRVKERDDAYRRLIMLASDSLFTWLMDVYNPSEYELKKAYVRKVRYGQPVDDEALRLRRSFSRLLREDLIRQFRPEVAVLRDPIHAQHLRPVRRRHTGESYRP